MMIIVQADKYRDGGSLSLTIETDGMSQKVWIQFNLTTHDYETPVLRTGTSSSDDVLPKLTWKDLQFLLMQAHVDFSKSRFHSALRRNLGQATNQKDVEDYFSACECHLNTIRNLAEVKTSG